jgi:orotate phosphoribosyltransferase
VVTSRAAFSAQCGGVSVSLRKKQPGVPVKREILRDRIQDRCLDFSHEYTLSTGEKSNFYFDCKKATLDGELLSPIADAFLEMLKTLPEMPQAIGGLTMGADSISTAVVMRAFQEGLPTISASIVRKEPKKHGTKNFIENQLPRGTTIAVVDDVITTGSSIDKACRHFLAAEYRIVGILALVDREAGGAEKLKKDFDCSVLSLFRKRDFPKLVEAEREKARSSRVAGAA